MCGSNKKLPAVQCHEFTHDAAGTYARTATETASPRELEATLLLRAAGKLQAVREAWSDKPTGLSEALLYNRRLWILLMDAVMRDDNKLPSQSARIS